MLFLIFAFSVITMSLAASLVRYFQYGSGGSYPPGGSYGSRIRLLLAASVITLAFTIYLGIGVIAAMANPAFGIMIHLILYFISFVLVLSGAAALTNLTVGYNCAQVTWSRCNIVKGLVANSWILTILLFVMLWWIFFVGLKRNRGIMGGLGGDD
ncbi:BQ2448_1977 [Microbotryum intermedium]|uniref:BQ2448_1977 protein n=1 Tax=Microbotryum intermedium TaxID=269621 RepID=A0A238F728_9BASI|nr:BQ2448_1977 [Microbotryum intermedium]